MKTPLSRVRLNIFADYNQFYIWDPDLEEVKAPEDYSDEDIANRVKLGPGVVVAVRSFDEHQSDIPPLRHRACWQSAFALRYAQSTVGPATIKPRPEI